MGEMGSPHMGKWVLGFLLKKTNLISDIWEKWGRHIWGKGVLGFLLKKTNLISDIWEKWGRHIWGKGVLGI